MADDVALNTNLLYWATTTPNIGVEAGLSDHFSLGVAIGYNAFNFPNSKSNPNLNPKLHHWLLMPEGKYWFSDTFHKSYLGFHILGGQYNVGGLKFPHVLSTTRYQGWGIGAGVSYGYMWHLGRRWQMEFSAGVGYIYLNYSKYKCGNCGKRLGSRSRNYVGPTKLALSVYYILPSGHSHTPVKELDTVLPPDQFVISDSAIHSEIPLRDSVTPNYEDAVRVIEVAPDTLRFTVHYAVDRSEIRADLAGNRREFARIDSLLSSYSKNNSSSTSSDSLTILSVKVEGYASPEHNFHHNKRLSADRATAVKDWLEQRYALPVSIESVGVGEDLSSFKKSMHSRFGDGYAEILSPDNFSCYHDKLHDNLQRLSEDPDVMEMNLKKRASTADYKIITKEIYPDLRRTEIVIVVKPK